jgi:hypothetical protein
MKAVSLMPAMIRRALPAFVLLFGATLSYSEGQELRQLNAAPVRSATSICGLSVEPPIALPPRDSGPVVYKLAACFERQGGRVHVTPTLYLRDVRLEVSRPAEGIWVPYDANTAIPTVPRRPKSNSTLWSASAHSV